MPQRPPRVVRFISAELLEGPSKQCTARVDLKHESDRDCVGEVKGGCSEVEGLRAVAQATADALMQAVNTGEDSMEVTGLEIKETFGKRSIVVAISAYYFRQRRELMGFCVIEDNPPRAAALAVLNATNRFLGVG